MQCTLRQNKWGFSKILDVPTIGYPKRLSKTFKANTPALLKVGEETFDLLRSTGRAVAEAATEVTKGAAIWLVEVLSEEDPHTVPVKTSGPAKPGNGKDIPNARRSQEASQDYAYTATTLLVCVKGGCLNPRASEQFMCWEHLYETNAYELAALRAREQLQQQEDQRLATLCTWKSCANTRVIGEFYCAFHKRENEQLKARRCGQKIRYTSVEEARTAAQRMHDLDSAAFNVYSCNFCERYHIGHAKRY